ncbi:MAG: CAAX prenyl protease-related protein [Lentisphaeria bacterium]
MAALSYIGEPSAWKYALRTALCLVLLLFLRPWRYYSAPRWRDIPWGIGGGILALGIWLLPEISWSSNGPFLQEMYLRFGIMPLGRLPAATETSIYDPRIAGWFMALTRLAGSAFVIAIIEEFFWRGFLYRWLIERRFTRLSPATWDVEAFLIMVLLFGLEHNRWLAGMAAGAVYGALMIYTRSIWSACFAHIVTNLLLGIYVLNAGAYVFW